MSELNTHIREQAVKLGTGEIESFALKLEWLERAKDLAQLEKGRAPNINASYVRTLVNRVKEVERTSRTVQVRMVKQHKTVVEMTDPDTGDAYEETFFDDVLIVSLGKIVQRKKRASKTDEALYRDGFRAGLKVAESFVPDFVGFTPEQFEFAQNIVRQYRNHIETAKEGIKQ